MIEKLITHEEGAWIKTGPHNESILRDPYDLITELREEIEQLKNRVEKLEKSDKRKG